MIRKSIILFDFFEIIFVYLIIFPSFAMTGKKDD